MRAWLIVLRVFSHVKIESRHWMPYLLLVLSRLSDSEDTIEVLTEAGEESGPIFLA